MWHCSLEVKQARHLPNMRGMTLAQKKQTMVETARQSVLVWCAVLVCGVWHFVLMCGVLLNSTMLC